MTSYQSVKSYSFGSDYYWTTKSTVEFQASNPVHGTDKGPYFLRMG